MKLVNTEKENTLFLPQVKKFNYKLIILLANFNFRKNFYFSIFIHFWLNFILPLLNLNFKIKNKK